MNDSHRDHYHHDVNLVLKISAPVLLLAGCVGNALIVVVVARTRKRYRSFGNVFISLALTDSLQLLVCLFPRYLEAFIQAHFDVKGHWMCRLNSFLFYFLFGASSLLLSAFAAQRAASVLWPHWVKAAYSSEVSMASIIGVFVVVLTLSYPELQWLSSDYHSCYFGSSAMMAHEYRHTLQRLLTWARFFGLFLFPFLVILISNSILIRRVRASWDSCRRARSKKITTAVPQAMLGFVERLVNMSSSSVTVALSLWALFFCACVMPWFLLDVLVTTGDVDRRSITSLTKAMLDLLVFLKCASNFYLYSTGRGFRQELSESWKAGKFRCMLYRKNNPWLCYFSGPTSGYSIRGSSKGTTQGPSPPLEDTDTPPASDGPRQTSHQQAADSSPGQVLLTGSPGSDQVDEPSPALQPSALLSADLLPFSEPSLPHSSDSVRPEKGSSVSVDTGDQDPAGERLAMAAPVKKTSLKGRLTEMGRRLSVLVSLQSSAVDKRGQQQTARPPPLMSFSDSTTSQLERPDGDLATIALMSMSMSAVFDPPSTGSTVQGDQQR